jgi:hypothetical protein
MKAPRASAWLLASLAQVGFGAGPARPAKAEKSEWVFSLLPKSLQKNPRLELTVVTEMTEAGKKLPPVTPANPAYFEAYTPGPKHRGHSEAAGRTVAQEEIERVLTRSLATNGYLPFRRPEHPPTLLIIYTWGAHSLLVEADPENPSLPPEMVARNLLDRAALVGGEKFAREMLELFDKANAMSLAASARVPPGGEQIFTPEMMAFANPVHQFRMSNPKNEFLVDQTASDIFYVSASAYDYRGFSENRRQLLWRTRMTVAAAGVSQQQSLPSLIVSAAPFFGKETTEPQIIHRRALREGSVELGTPIVVEDKAKTPPPAEKK